MNPFLIQKLVALVSKKIEFYNFEKYVTNDDEV